MKGGGLRWQLENVGYRLFLANDLSLQNAFGFYCSAANRELSYGQKLKLLLYLGFMMKTGKTLEEIWEGHRKPAKVQEWNNSRISFASAMKQLLVDLDTIQISVRGNLAVPVFPDPEEEKAFLAEAKRSGKEKPLAFVLNEWLTDWICRNCGDKEIQLFVDPEDSALLDFMSAQAFTNFCTLIKGEVEFPLYFPDIQKLHSPYRPLPSPSPVLSFWQALCTKEFWSSPEFISDLYAVGYQYGGLPCVGFCQWLHRLLEREKVDLLVFCSRDCDVIRQVHSLLFPRDPQYYLEYSRRAMGEVFFEERPEQFLDAFFLPKIRNRAKPCRIGEALRQLGFHGQEEILRIAGIRGEEPLTMQAYRRLKEIPEFYDRMKEHLKTARKAGLEGLEMVIRPGKKVCVVDIGWHGTALEQLRLFAEMQGKGAEVIGALMAGSRTEKSGTWQDLGVLHTWLFADDRDRADRRYGHPLDRRQVLCMERLFSSPAPKVLHYVFCGNATPGILFNRENPFKAESKQIQRGILTFAENMAPYLENCGLTVSREEAWSVLRDLLGSRDRTAGLLSRFTGREAEG